MKRLTQNSNWSVSIRKSTRNFKLITRFIFSSIFFILGFIVSYNAFFKEFPLYQIPFLGESVVALFLAFLGYYIIPSFLLKTLDWFENLIVKTISDIVNEFWYVQSKKLNEKRRVKQKLKSREDKDRLRRDLQNAVLVDTSILIDGRILEIIKAGFLDNTLVIIPNVLRELHLISDSEDKMKRERGRRGLTVFNEIKKITKIISPVSKSKEVLVDNALIDFAKTHGVKLMTLDFNLGKLAETSDVKILNINKLVEAVKTTVLPGEELAIKVLQKGKEKNQGIGYLFDGTMVVIEDAGDKEGEEINVKVSKVIQKDSGKIIFSKIITS